MFHNVHTRLIPLPFVKLTWDLVGTCVGVAAWWRVEEEEEEEEEIF
jgi:hypothetical protein